MVLNRLGRREEAQTTLETALPMSPPETRAATLGALAEIVSAGGDMPRALSLEQEALALATATGDQQRQQLLHAGISRFLRHLGRGDEGKVHLDIALKLARELGNRHAEARCLGDSGVLWVLAGHSEPGCHAYRAAIALFEEVGDRGNLANFKANLGLELANRGDHTQALQHLQGALSIRREIGAAFGLGACLVQLGNVLVELDRHTHALEALEEAEPLLLQAGNLRFTAVGRLYRGTCLLELGREARPLLNEAIDQLHAIGDRRMEAAARLVLARAHGAHGEGHQEWNQIQEAMVLVDALNAPRQRLSALCHRGNAHFERGRVAQARLDLQAADALVDELGPTSVSPRLVTLRERLRA